MKLSDTEESLISPRIKALCSLSDNELLLTAMSDLLGYVTEFAQRESARFYHKKCLEGPPDYLMLTCSRRALEHRINQGKPPMREDDDE